MYSSTVCTQYLRPSASPKGLVSGDFGQQLTSVKERQILTCPPEAMLSSVETIRAISHSLEAIMAVTPGSTFKKLCGADTAR